MTHCEENKNKLDLSLRETAVLTSRLEVEKKQREMELNQSFYMHECENDEKLEIMKQLKDLKAQQKTTICRYESLLLENSNIKNQIKKV